MMKVKVGGVPEHFNLAWHLAMENGSFKKAGIEIDWQDVPGGTGAMCKSLREGELDIAIGLTEGMISDIMQGNPSKIVQFYVNSPLRWGIYASGRSAIQSVDDMAGKRYAISRYKSGSHLMARVNASRNGLTVRDEDFVVVGNLEGARKALAADEAQLFMWEKFTTKPYADSGEFKFIGECRTPWPCFVIAVSDQFLAQHRQALVTILNTVQLSCLLLKNNSAASQLIASRYGITEADAAAWFKELEYVYYPELNEYQMLDVFVQMKQFGLIDRIPALDEVCDTHNMMMME